MMTEKAHLTTRLFYMIIKEVGSTLWCHAVDVAWEHRTFLDIGDA